jgi:predicted Zn finger-like uncharacterized protein
MGVVGRAPTWRACIVSMVTSCPACTTTFRVTQEQLKHRQGKVRCGQCRIVFDGFKSLASFPDDSPPEEIAPPQEQRAPPPRSVDAESASAASTEQGRLDIDAAQPGTTLPASEVASPALPASRSRRRAWWIAAVLLALGLIAQFAYLLRDQVSALWPATRPLYEQLCARTGCTLSFPRRSEQLAIESSDLQADPARPSVIVLTAALRNRGRTVVAHPAIELTLTNAQDQALARRIFLPADYLPNAADGERGMAALAEVNVRIALETGDLKPAGYRLFLFYP